MAEQSNWPEGVKPLDVDGVGAVAIGTAAWVVALVVLLLLRNQLAETGSEWWIWVAGTGAALGLPGLWYSTRRRSAYRSAQSADSAVGSLGAEAADSPVVPDGTGSADGGGSE